MASFNGQEYIKAQIDSILCQLPDDAEFIISDDGSTDATVDIINSYNDPRIRLIKNQGHHSTRANSVNALMEARGDIIFMADQDDVWMPGKVDAMLLALPGYDCVHHDSIVTDSNLNEVAPSLFAIKHNGPGIIKNMLKGSFYGSHMVITRRLLDLCIPFPDDDEVGHDLWIGLVASMKAKINYIPDKLVYYRRHEDAHCDLFAPSKRSFFKKIAGRLVMIKYIIKFLYTK